MKNTAVLFILFTFISLTSFGQSVLYDYDHANHIRVELNKPLFKGDGIGFLSIGGFINGHFKVGNTSKIAVELPISRLSSDFGGSSTDIGNIGIALQLKKASNSNFFELRARLPTAGEGGLFGSGAVGILTDYTERITAFVNDLISVGGSYFHMSNSGMGGYFKFRPTVDILIPTGDNNDTEVIAGLNLGAGYRNEKIDFAAGVTSAIIITEDTDNLDERINRQLFSTLSFTTGNFHPGIVLRVPLGNDLNDTYDLSIGASLNFIIGQKKSGDE